MDLNLIMNIIAALVITSCIGFVVSIVIATVIYFWAKR